MRIVLSVCLLAVAALLGLAALTVDRVDAADCYSYIACDVTQTSCSIYPAYPNQWSMVYVLGAGAKWDPYGGVQSHGGACAQVYFDEYGTGYCDTGAGYTGCYLLSGRC